jgi:hypothetical protein
MIAWQYTKIQHCNIECMNTLWKWSLSGFMVVVPTIIEALHSSPNESSWMS